MCRLVKRVFYTVGLFVLSPVGRKKQIGRIFGDGKDRIKRPVFDKLCGRGGDLWFVRVSLLGIEPFEFHEELWITEEKYRQKQKADQRSETGPEQNIRAQQDQLVIGSQKDEKAESDDP